MDKIWDRKSVEVGGHGRCGGDEKTKWPRRTDKSPTLKKKIKKNIHAESDCYYYCSFDKTHRTKIKPTKGMIIVWMWF